MREETPFRDLIHQVRAGDEAAAAELLRQYEPAVRRAIRVHLVSPRLRRVFDSMDVCQSVMASFFARAALNQYDLEQPEQLLGLLVAMVRHKLTDLARQQGRDRRNHHRVVAGRVEEMGLPAADSTPSQEVIRQELVQKVHERLTPEECYLAEQRALGREWNEIAAERGTSPEALRKRLTRALSRAKRDLGLEELDDERI
jgi:RNA polymerase sigma-70 factor (ECF subfamily)